MVTKLKQLLGAKLARRFSDPASFKHEALPAPGVYRRATTFCTTSSSSSKRGEENANDLAIEAAHDRKDRFRGSLPQSLVKNHDQKDCVAPFKSEEIIYGSWLGSGEFSNVYEVKSFLLEPSADTNLTEEEAENKHHLKRRERYRKTGKASYAIKRLKEDFLAGHDPLQYSQAASDLVLEAEFLCCLQHPHIIKLRGIAQSGANGFAQGPGGYFLIIDRLSETLRDRIIRWRNEDKRKGKISSLKSSLQGSVRRSSTGGTNFGNARKMMALDERLSIALQIAAAVKYLHEHTILFRDLKPCNIGFDGKKSPLLSSNLSFPVNNLIPHPQLSQVRGDIKLFDFGLARVMPTGNDPYVDKFVMSGAGTPRYMAPEVLSNQAYNLKADVYSFSIIVWEMLAARIPYAFVRTKEELIRYVVNQNGRPEIADTWPDLTKGVLKNSFDVNTPTRPRMDTFYNLLRQQLTILRLGDNTGLNDTYINRRRSFYSLRAFESGLR